MKAFLPGADSVKSTGADSVKTIVKHTKKLVRINQKLQLLLTLNKTSGFYCGKLKNPTGADSVKVGADSVKSTGADSVKKYRSNHCYYHVLAKMNTRTVPLNSFCIKYIGNFYKSLLSKTKIQKQSIFLKLSIIGSLTISSLVFADAPLSFSKAKKLMYQKVYFDHPQTFYCGCNYSNRKVNLKGCGYQVRKNKLRASRTEAEHIVPAYQIAQLTPHGRTCWLEGTRRKGTNGRKYCLKNNKQFRQAHNDLMNLVPAIGEVNGDRSNYPFAMIPGEVREYGACDFEINNSGATTKRIFKTVEPTSNIRGDIARTYFYMSKQYGLKLSNQTWQLMNAWDKLDPIDGWEQERINRIKLIQGE